MSELTIEFLPGVFVLRNGTAHREFVRLLGKIKSLEEDLENAISATDYVEYSTDEAIRIAKLWRAGKMIGGNEAGVRDALLKEIEGSQTAQCEFSSWSFLRAVLEQGMAIQQDYTAGKYPDYEHLSARLDGAARERDAQLEKARKPHRVSR